MKILIICGDHYRHRFIIEPIFQKFKRIKCVIMRRESQKKGKKTLLLNNSIFIKIFNDYLNLRSYLQ